MDRTGLSRARRSWGTGAVGLLLIGCGHSSSPPESSARSPNRSSERAVEAAQAGGEDPRLREAALAIEEGDADLARAKLSSARGGEATLALLLEARLALLVGEPVEALRALEEARRRSPRDGRVYATGAEIYAVLGRSRAAAEEIQKGESEAGKGAALERARGVLALTRPGGAAAGLSHLERALALDPELPFLRLPLSQAHLLVGRSVVSERPDLAREHARRSIGLAPEDPDARELLAEACAALGDLEEALAIYEQLDDPGSGDGRDRAVVRATLHQKAATLALLERDRPRAVRHYRSARELGLGGEELGFGATVLAEEAERSLEAGIASYETGEWPAALERFQEAMGLDPENLGARNHAAVVLFRLERFGEAAALWREVWDALEANPGTVLPEPVHLNLARALVLAGEPARARAVVETYLEREPEGPWSESSRELLGRIP